MEGSFDKQGAMTTKLLLLAFSKENFNITIFFYFH